jgi:hypothetical protein
MDCSDLPGEPWTAGPYLRETRAAFVAPRLVRWLFSGALRSRRWRVRCARRCKAGPFEAFDLLPHGLRFLDPARLLVQVAESVQEKAPVLHVSDGQPGWATS